MAWYVAVAKNGRALRAKAELDGKRIAAIVPMERFYRRNKGRRFVVAQPLLGRYLFAEADDDHGLNQILNTPDVDNVLRDEKGFPREIDGAMATAFRDADQAGAFDKTSAERDPEAGDQIRFVTGPYRDMLGTLVKRRGYRRWEVVVSFFGRPGKMVAADTAMELVVDEKGRAA